MIRIFWIECPECGTRWYVDWELRYAEYRLICPSCRHTFQVEDAPWIDERW